MEKLPTIDLTLENIDISSNLDIIENTKILSELDLSLQENTLDITLDTTGGTGVLSGDKHFTFKQETASDIWHIYHNLGKEPSVTIVDSAGTVVTGDVIISDKSQLVIKFSAPFSGTAYCN